MRIGHYTTDYATLKHSEGSECCDWHYETVKEYQLGRKPEVN